MNACRFRHTVAFLRLRSSFFRQLPSRHCAFFFVAVRNMRRLPPYFPPAFSFCLLPADARRLRAATPLRRHRAARAPFSLRRLRRLSSA